MVDTKGQLGRVTKIFHQKKKDFCLVTAMICLQVTWENLPTPKQRNHWSTHRFPWFMSLEITANRDRAQSQREKSEWLTYMHYTLPSFKYCMIARRWSTVIETCSYSLTDVLEGLLRSLTVRSEAVVFLGTSVQLLVLTVWTSHTVFYCNANYTIKFAKRTKEKKK